MGNESEVTLKVKADTSEAKASLDQATDATTGLVKETEKLPPVADKVSQSFKEVATQEKAASDAGGGLADVFKGFESSVTKVNQTLELVAKGLDLAKKAIVAIQEASKSAGESFVAFNEKMVKQQNEMDKYDAALRAVSKGYIEAGKSIAEMINNYDSYISATQHATQATDKFAESIAGLKVPPTFDQLSKEATAVNTALANAFNEGGDRFKEFANANAAALEEIVKNYERMGHTVPEYIAKAVKANEDLAKSEEKQKQAIEDGKHAMEDKLKGMSEVWTKQQEAIKAGEEIIKQEKAGALGYNESKNALKEIAAQYGLTEQGLRELIRANKDYVDGVKEAHGIGPIIEPETLAMIDEYIAKLNELESAQRAASDAASQHQQILNDLSNAMVQNGASGRGLADINKAIADSTQAGQEPVVRMQILYLKLTEATEGQIEALKKMGGAMGEVAGDANMLDDYLAQLLTGFTSGMTSAFATIEQLNTTMQQLRELLAKNMGTQFEGEIRRMIAAYTELRDQLMSGSVKKEEKLRT